LAYGKTENGKETVGIIPVLAWRGWVQLRNPYQENKLHGQESSLSEWTQMSYRSR
jgi:hypothetical protein